MGRIKTTVIKRTAERLMKKQEFSEDFEKNKKLLKDTMPSKKMRNKVAGYIGRLQKRKNAKRKSLEHKEDKEVKK